ncbi:hypothetical protein GCM10022630_26360 [Thermobifida alba]
MVAHTAYRTQTASTPAVPPAPAGQRPPLADDRPREIRGGAGAGPGRDAEPEHRWARWGIEVRKETGDRQGRSRRAGLREAPGPEGTERTARRTPGSRPVASTPFARCRPRPVRVGRKRRWPSSATLRDDREGARAIPATCEDEKNLISVSWWFKACAAGCGDMRAISRGVLLACLSFVAVWAVVAALLWLRSTNDPPPGPPGEVVVGESSEDFSRSPDPSPPAASDPAEDDVVNPPPAVTDDDDDWDDGDDDDDDDDDWEDDDGDDDWDDDDD